MGKAQPAVDIPYSDRRIRGHREVGLQQSPVVAQHPVFRSDERGI